jgi:hypothetical protein
MARLGPKMEQSVLPCGNWTQTDHSVLDETMWTFDVGIEENQ